MVIFILIDCSVRTNPAWPGVISGARARVTVVQCATTVQVGMVTALLQEISLAALAV